jgi:hypothetical protein
MWTRTYRIAGVLVLGLSAFAGGAAAAKPAVGARISSVTGRVEVERAAKGHKREPAVTGMRVSPQDAVLTGPDGRAELEIGDRNLIEIQSNSKFRMGLDGGTAAGSELSRGLLLLKEKVDESGARSEIRTPTCVVAIRGTELAVSVDEAQGTTRAGVFEEGEVEVRSNAGGAVMLKPDQETSVQSGQAPAAPQKLEYFRFAAKRMDLLRQRQKYFLSRFQRKYGIHPK